MIDELINTNCFYPLNQGQHFIYDNDLNNIPDFVTENERWNLNLNNNTVSTVNFFQNDFCLMTQNGLKKCDWVCFKNNEFYFIEAKDVNFGGRGKGRRDAVEKFDATIPYFLNLYPEIQNMQLFVIMNFRSSKITSAANKSKAIYFEEEYNAEYRETNILEFN